MSRPERNRKLSRKDEQRLLQAGKRVLLVGFPNPDRIGCPGSEILKAIAFRKLDLPRSSQYIDHFGECSPCFSEYIAFREQAQRTKRVRLTAVAAIVVFTTCVLGWMWVRHTRSKGELSAYRETALDLRNASVTRGEESGRTGPFLELPRTRIHVSIYLPIGSEAGQYQVEIVSKDHGPLATAEGIATIESSGSLLKVTTDLSHLNPGDYFLGIRRPPSSWTYYPVSLK
jgi:hypothetical protein